MSYNVVDNVCHHTSSLLCLLFEQNEVKIHKNNTMFYVDLCEINLWVCLLSLIQIILKKKHNWAFRHKILIIFYGSAFRVYCG